MAELPPYEARLIALAAKRGGGLTPAEVSAVIVRDMLNSGGRTSVSSLTKMAYSLLPEDRAYLLAQGNLPERVYTVLHAVKA